MNKIFLKLASILFISISIFSCESSDIFREVSTIGTSNISPAVISTFLQSPLRKNQWMSRCSKLPYGKQEKQLMVKHNQRLKHILNSDKEGEKLLDSNLSLTQYLTKCFVNSHKPQTHAVKPTSDFLVSAHGNVISTSQEQMKKSLSSILIPNKETRSMGREFFLKNGMSVRAMEAAGKAPKRASFENNKGQAVDLDGNFVIPPKHLTKKEKIKYFRMLTHVTQY